MSKECGIDGCTQKHHLQLLMCKGHWLGLPKHLRTALWDAYRSEEGILGDAYHDAYDKCFAYYNGRRAV